jgi:Domain of unknown function (DUF4263)
MEFKDFRDISLSQLNSYFEIIQDSAARTFDKSKGSVLFPNLALFIETDEHFVVELFGMNDSFLGLNEKTHKERSIVNYLAQDRLIGNGEAGRFTLEGGISGGISGIFIRREFDYEIFRQRFPFHRRLWDETAQFVLRGGDGYYFNFKSTFKHCYMNNCTLGNRFGNIHRIKHVNFIAIVSKTLQSYPYQVWLSELLCTSLIRRSQSLLNVNFQDTANNFNDVFGIQVCSSQREKISVLASQFANIFLIPGIAEPSIGDFLRDNPAFTKAAFSCESFICQAKLPWIEGNPDTTEQSIIPDLLLQREDGYFDICELKLPNPKQRSITKGPRRRRRFIDYVNEGISQLANYEDYFKYPKNAQLAESKFGIKISNPRLLLVVGSYENATAEEIQEASRSLQNKISIVDYDMLNSLAFNSSKIFSS